MTRIRRFPFLTLLVLGLALLLSGCGEAGLLDLYGGEEAILIESIAPGTVLVRGEAIPVSASADESASDPAYMELRIEDQEGELILLTEESASSTPLVISTEDFPPGYFMLTIRALDGDRNELSESEVPFFISLSDGTTLIKGISAYPTAVLPREGIVFYAELAQLSGDPYLRWSADGRTIGEGRVSDGSQLISWRVPESEGIYPVIAELFPFPPPGNESFRFNAAERFKIEAFVSSDPRTPRGELGPAEDYSVLFHFRGTFDSAGFLDLPDPQIDAEPLLVVESGIFGFQFTSEETIRIAESLLPADGGRLDPFTLHLKGIFSDPGRIVSVLNTRNEEFFRLSRSPAGVLLAIDGRVYELALPGELLASPRYLALSFDSYEEGLLTRWFLDGTLQQADRLPQIALPGNLSETLIGGGFSGTLDEFGIYAGRNGEKAASDPELFGFAMRERYGRRLLFARGFDDAAPQQGIRLNGEQVRSDIRTSSLRVPASALLEIELPPWEVAEGRIELEFTEPIEGLGFALLDEADPVETSLGRASSAPDGTVTIRWRQSGAFLEYSSASGSKLFRLEMSDDARLMLRLQAPPDRALLLDSVVIIRGDESLAAEAEEEADSPEV